MRCEGPATGGARDEPTTFVTTQWRSRTRTSWPTSGAARAGEAVGIVSEVQFIRRRGALFTGIGHRDGVKVENGPMSYTPLKTDAAPQSIRDFVRLHVDMQLLDVHTMLRLPFGDQPGMEGGCNFATVSVLCSVIAGASTVFFRQNGLAGPRFEELLIRFYPWDVQPRGGVEPDIAVRAIYKEYRNPLAHALAVSTRTVGRGADQRILVDTRRIPLGVIKRALTEDAITALEVPDGPPPTWLTPVV